MNRLEGECALPAMHDLLQFGERIRCRWGQIFLNISYFFYKVLVLTLSYFLGFSLKGPLEK